MRQRFFYDEYEDVRMLKWVVKNCNLDAVGNQIWRRYVDKYNNDHTVFSLNGRLRRQIVPNLIKYVPHLTSFELEYLYITFQKRLDQNSKERIRKLILRNPDVEDVPVPVTVEKEEILIEDSEDEEENAVEVAREAAIDDDEVVQHVQKNDEDTLLEERDEIQIVATESEIPRLQEEENSVFLFEDWNSSMKPIAIQSARSIFEKMQENREELNWADSKIQNSMSANTLEDLFNQKMFPEHQNVVRMELTLLGAPPTYRLRAFGQFKRELEKKRGNPHAETASTWFFEYFELIAFKAAKNENIYKIMVNDVIQAAIRLL